MTLGPEHAFVRALFLGVSDMAFSRSLGDECANIYPAFEKGIKDYIERHYPSFTGADVLVELQQDVMRDCLHLTVAVNGCEIRAEVDRLCFESYRKKAIEILLKGIFVRMVDIWGPAETFDILKKSKAAPLIPQKPESWGSW